MLELLALLLAAAAEVAVEVAQDLRKEIHTSPIILYNS
jgi:hypothetical protein